MAIGNQWRRKRDWRLKAAINNKLSNLANESGGLAEIHLL